MGKKKKKRAKRSSKKRQSTRTVQAQPAPALPPGLDQVEQLLQAGRFPQAMEVLRENAQPQHRRFLEQWGRRCMGQQNFDAAVSLFEVVADLFPDDDKAHNALAVAWSMAGFQDQALEEMRRCVELAPDSWRHRLNLGKLYMVREEWEAAKVELEAALGGASAEYRAQIQEYLAFCQQKLDFPIVELGGMGSGAVDRV